MDIENLRSPYAVPISPMMRTPKCMDESEPFVPPVVRPSTDHLEPSLGERVNDAIKRSDYISGQNALLRKIVGAYMKRDGTTEAEWGFAELLKSDPVYIKPDGGGGYVGRLKPW